MILVADDNRVIGDSNHNYLYFIFRLEPDYKDLTFRVVIAGHGTFLQWIIFHLNNSDLTSKYYRLGTFL